MSKIFYGWWIVSACFLNSLYLGGAVVLGFTAFLADSGVISLGMFYGTFALIAIGTSGLSPTVMITPLGNWFRRKLGLANGIMGCGFALGGLIVPIVVKLIDANDWRTALWQQP